LPSIALGFASFSQNILVAITFFLR
jgi:hypothetical protein